MLTLLDLGQLLLEVCNFWILKVCTCIIVWHNQTIDFLQRNLYLNILFILLILTVSHSENSAFQKQAVAALPLEKALMPELWFSLLAYGVNVADRNLQIWESNLGHRVRWDIASVLYVPIVLIKFIFYPNMGNRQTLTNFFFKCNNGNIQKNSDVPPKDLTMEGRLRTDHFKNWVSGNQQRYRKPSPNLSVFASKRCVLIRHLPNNIILREVFLQGYIFGRVKDMLITPVEERPNSSRFLRVEFFRKNNCEQFVKDFEQIPFFAGCTVELFKITPNNYYRETHMVIIGIEEYLITCYSLGPK